MALISSSYLQKPMASLILVARVLSSWTCAIVACFVCIAFKFEFIFYLIKQNYI